MRAKNDFHEAIARDTTAPSRSRKLNFVVRLVDCHTITPTFMYLGIWDYRALAQLVVLTRGGKMEARVESWTI